MMENKKFEVEIDPREHVRVMKVNGVKFSFDVFDCIANPRNRLYTFVRDGDTVTVTDQGPAPVRECAALAPAEARPRQYERR